MGDFLEWRFDRSVRVLIAAVLWVGDARAPRRPAARDGPGLRGDRRHAARRRGAPLDADPDRVLRRAEACRRRRSSTCCSSRPCSSASRWPCRLPGRRAAAGPGCAPPPDRTRPASAASRAWACPASSGSPWCSCPRSSCRPGSTRRPSRPARRRRRGAAALGNAAGARGVRVRARRVRNGHARGRSLALANPELALPRLTTDVLPPWLGGLALAALFAAEISTADAVLFMLSTSLSRDLFQARAAAEGDRRGAAARRPARDRRRQRAEPWARAAAAIGGDGAAALLRRDDGGALRSVRRGSLVATPRRPSCAGRDRRVDRGDARAADRSARPARRRVAAVGRGHSAGRRRLRHAWLGKRPGRGAGASIESI